MVDFRGSIFMREPNLTPLTTIHGHPGLPVRSNVIEVDGRFRRIKKRMGGRRGMLDLMANGDSHTRIDWLEE